MSYADRRELFTENVGPVAGAVHPALHHLLRGLLAPGDIFAGAAVLYPLLSQSGAKAASIGTGVGKAILDFPGTYQGGSSGRLADGQGLESRLGPFLVDQGYHLLGKGQGAAPRG